MLSLGWTHGSDAVTSDCKFGESKLVGYFEPILIKGLNLYTQFRKTTSTMDIPSPNFLLHVDPGPQVLQHPVFLVKVKSSTVRKRSTFDSFQQKWDKFDREDSGVPVEGCFCKGDCKGYLEESCWKLE